MLFAWLMGVAAMGQVRTDLILEISAETLNLKTGEFPKVTATLANRGSEPVVLVLPGDGSQSGDRTPITSWNIAVIWQSRSPEPEPEAVGACGNMNPLMSDEVITLQPGRSQLLEHWVSLQPFRTPGTYSVQFTYRNDPDQKWKTDPSRRHNPEAMQRVRRSTACDLASNHLTFNVR